MGEILVVEDTAPLGHGLVRGEDHRTLPAMAIVDDMEEHVGGVGAVRQIADFVDDEQIGMRVRREGVHEPARAKRGRQIVDQLSPSDETCIEAVLNRSIGNRDREMRFPAPRLAAQDQRTTFGDEVR